MVVVVVVIVVLVDVVFVIIVILDVDVVVWATSRVDLRLLVVEVEFGCVGWVGWVGWWVCKPIFVSKPTQLS